MCVKVTIYCFTDNCVDMIGYEDDAVIPLCRSLTSSLYRNALVAVGKIMRSAKICCNEILSSSLRVPTDAGCPVAGKRYRSSSGGGGGGGGSSGSSNRSRCVVMMSYLLWLPTGVA